MCTSSAWHRRSGAPASGARLYDRFAAAVRGHGCTTVHAVTSTANEASVAFHTKLGFEVERVAADYDGPGEDRVLLVRRL